MNKMQLTRQWFRYRLEYEHSPLVELRGLKRRHAVQLGRWLRVVYLRPSIDAAAQWKQLVQQTLDYYVQSSRWLPREVVDGLEAVRPSQSLKRDIDRDGLRSLLTSQELGAVDYATEDLAVDVQSVNDRVVEQEFVRRREFFLTIEKTPLSDEQARAVVCFDNRVQVLAAAGSGKTSVMIARAAYAVSRDIVPPDRILMLAFNSAAAAEMQERITRRFDIAGIASTGVRASTFHSFGLEVIGRATGRKPRVASWLEQGRELEKVLEIANKLRDSSSSFRYNWDVYRLLFANTSTRINDDVPDGYDRDTHLTGHRTFSGVMVKSQGERLIADFLFLNGVNFEYERRYPFETADETHGQYHPDFYYPDVDLWHEHWALDQDGNPPSSFAGYRDSMDWKRRIHADHGTRLIETTWADIVFGDGLNDLANRLTAAGIELDWNPDREMVDRWATPIEHEDMVRLVRTFMSHVKSNSFTRETLEGRRRSSPQSYGSGRTGVFLAFYWPIHDEWERQLANENSVDFEDMLVRAAELLENEGFTSPYDLIMVDEFQDCSQARARVVRALVNAPGRYLLTVGDDWQSINRFAGADVSVMTGFEEWFGSGPQVALTTTFRCSQPICDVARTFVMKNPAQFKKSMTAARLDTGQPVTVMLADDDRGAIRTVISRLAAEAAEASQPDGQDRPITIDVLGRYRFQRDLVPINTSEQLTVTFRTIHSSKGLEADYIIIPGMSTGTYGFPSTISDDPILSLAMPVADDFPHAEERRLFYVALTRARRGVFVIGSHGTPSPFMAELLSYPNVTVETADGLKALVCPQCERGTLVTRHGTNGPFLGCSRFPACTHRESAHCPSCGHGILVMRRSQYGPFIGCSQYPRCRHKQSLGKGREPR